MNFRSMCAAVAMHCSAIKILSVEQHARAWCVLFSVGEA